MLIEELSVRHQGNTMPMVIRDGAALSFSDVAAAAGTDLSEVRPGDVVALVGDFDPASINAILRLIDKRAIVAPLSLEMASAFPYFFEAAGVDVVVRDGRAERIRSDPMADPLLARLRSAGHSGLILFSSGTTGRPKAILHDFEAFLIRFRTRRPALRTLNFLLFDHIGGINTLFHTMFNLGQVIIPGGRTPELVAEDVARYAIELLPATPTFLRMLLMSGIPLERPAALSSLKVVTYGTEPMDQDTLTRLCAIMPGVDFRQTFGMSELGILRVKSRARDSLWMSIGGEGVETIVGEDRVLHIRSEQRMLGYLNAPSPFDADGWYDTGDVVESDGPFIMVVGRSKQVINVGGIKILPTELQRVALLHPGVARCKAIGMPNPITGQHIEITCELTPGSKTDRTALRAHFAAHLQPAVRPHRIRIGEIAINHRFKQQ